MNKTLLIIKREFLTRVRKRSFILMTFLGPLFMAAVFVVPLWVNSAADENLKKLQVLNQSDLPDSVFSDTEYTHYNIRKQADLESIKNNFADSDYDALLHIPEGFPDSAVKLYSFSHIEIDLKKHTNSVLERFLETQNLNELGITPDQLAKAKTEVNVKTVKWSENGDDKTGSAVLNLIIGFVLALIIYMFIFIYGAQVMRGVLEEKTGRIVEILISSVKPFELMAGKIIGIALLALTQFALWVILTGGIVTVAGAVMADDMSKAEIQNTQTAGTENMQETAAGLADSEIFKALSDYNWGLLLLGFIFFFITGYLLYASLFAAIGAAVDSETDTQQFMMPVTVPLILAIIVAQAVISNPSGSLAFWFSIIPFTAPVLMPVRLAFDAVATWEFLLAAGLMILFIAGTIWAAAKIYRNGILKYGQKSSYADLFKWIRQK